MIIIESLDHINIPTTNLEKSIEFYTMFLDFELVSNTENEEAIISFDDVLMVKLSPSEESSIISSYPVLSFILDVDDFTEGLQEIETGDIKIISGPDEIKNGESMVIADPSGNAIELYYKE